MEVILKDFQIRPGEDGTVKAVVGQIGVVDKQNDKLMPDFLETTTLPIGQYSHKSVKLDADPVGMATLEVVGNDIVMTGKWAGTPKAQETKELVDLMGEAQQWSMVVLAKVARKVGKVREIHKALIAEVCPVLIGAQETRTLAVAKAFGVGGDIKAVTAAPPTPPSDVTSGNILALEGITVES